VRAALHSAHVDSTTCARAEPSIDRRKRAASGALTPTVEYLPSPHLPATRPAVRSDDGGCAVKGKSTQPVRVRPKEVSVHLGSYPGGGKGD
jgi:hypothetical protein